MSIGIDRCQVHWTSNNREFILGPDWSCAQINFLTSQGVLNKGTVVSL